MKDKVCQTDKTRCSAITKRGQRCQGTPRPSSNYCFAHDPSLAAKRKTARVKGGKNSSRAARLEKLMPSRLRPAFARLERALQEVHDGSLDPRRATAMASLAGGMVKVFQAGQESGAGGQVPQFFYNAEEFYKEIREFRRRTPKLGPKPESGEEKQERLNEFIREYGTEKLPTEVI